MKNKYVNTGRKNQKLRTREKILKSAQEIMNKGKDFSLEDVANNASISRATIYRYYSNVEILAAEAVLDFNTKSSEEIYEEVKSRELSEAILAIQDYYNQLTEDNEAGFRKYLSVIIDAQADKRSRGARRKNTLLLALKQKSNKLTPKERENIANLATVLMGIEAFIVTKDVCGLNNNESKKLLKWGLEKILKEVLK
ncbi:TetR/AcrR family transcriptional regulator [Gramella sp. AN32]|uniref:TetR/AcrR family transcriptional regulator n=1 Tax=Christiangramia antarctica TaxID=2058158 RepID=A0ABW5X8H2_9FLAO|nr:TetR/AcrR family transcriptional regulator [Gramella sp. AN32]MCM4155330.1 TetR/AcrR family transcriptional regulator [Gramella sp. AN32]